MDAQVLIALLATAVLALLAQPKAEPARVEVPVRIDDEPAPR
jgi:hypothetical protein